MSRQDLLRILHRSDADIAGELEQKMVRPLYALRITRSPRQ